LKLERGAKFILMNKILFSFKLIFLFEEDFFRFSVSLDKKNNFWDGVRREESDESVCLPQGKLKFSLRNWIFFET
jgi:hypothetical protein